MKSCRRFPHRITFRSPTKTTEASGQVTRTMADAFKRWAKVEQTGGGQAEKNDQQKRSAEFEIKLRYDSALTDVDPDTWQIIWNISGQTLNISDMVVDRTKRVWDVTITAKLDE